MNDLEEEYFNWLYDLMCGSDMAKKTNFSKLLSMLYNRKFIWTIDHDRNRANEGQQLIYRFAVDNQLVPRRVERMIDHPCSMFEMMAALAIRCEENITDDATKGDRTSKWFWNMIKSLGLYEMTNSRFDPDYIDDVIDRFINHEYEPDGSGGLFTIKNCTSDLRTAEIWYQLCWYIDHMYGY